MTLVQLNRALRRAVSSFQCSDISLTANFTGQNLKQDIVEQNKNHRKTWTFLHQKPPIDISIL